MRLRGTRALCQVTPGGGDKAGCCRTRLTCVSAVRAVCPQFHSPLTRQRATLSELSSSEHPSIRRRSSALAASWALDELHRKHPHHSAPLSLIRDEVLPAFLIPPDADLKINAINQSRSMRSPPAQVGQPRRTAFATDFLRFFLPRCCRVGTWQVLLDVGPF